VIRQDQHGRADFDRLHSRCFGQEAIACAFDLLRLVGDDLRRRPFVDCKAALRKLLGRRREAFIREARRGRRRGSVRSGLPAGGLEGIDSKRLTAPYKSGPCKSWIKVRNPNSPAYLDHDGSFAASGSACIRR
jgi:bifunctional non-homologous end joining protein LigD